MQNPGPAQRFRDSMPEIAGCDMPLYMAWLECDREPMNGSLTLAGMLQVYELHGLDDIDPFEFRSLLRSMQAADREASKKEPTDG